MELLSVKDLADSQQYFGLYLQQLQQRVKALPALNTPVIGDALIKSDKDTTFWMQAMVPKGIKLDMKDLKQEAAMPLSSFLKFDPWTDQVIQIHPSFEPILSSRDKMPFEVEPIYLKLSYYNPPAPPATAVGAAPSPDAVPASAAAPTPAGTVAAQPAPPPQ
jgi:hypothetical protein